MLSFAIALFSVVVFQTDFKMVNEDITQVMQLTPNYKGLYMLALLGLIVWDILLVVKFHPIRRCMEFFDLENQKANEA